MAVAWAYDFDGATVIDVGGGLGGLMASVLDFHTSARGILFDRPNVIERLAERHMEGSLAQRCTLVAGDFFVSVPDGGDIYILSDVVADWPQELAVQLLHNCYAAMAKDSRLLVIDELAQPDAPVEFLLDDLQLALVFGGRVRALSEYEALFAEAGLRLQSVIPTWSSMSILEAIRADG
jgi:O-methyltransferase